MKNDNHTYEFLYHSSIHDTYGPGYPNRMSGYEQSRVLFEHQVQQKRKIRIYDILACLQIDYSEDFEDFCSSYGYSNDSIKVHKTYENIRKETRNLRKLWPSEKDQDLLNEIC